MKSDVIILPPNLPGIVYQEMLFGNNSAVWVETSKLFQIFFNQNGQVTGSSLCNNWCHYNVYDLHQVSEQVPVGVVLRNKIMNHYWQ